MVGFVTEDCSSIGNPFNGDEVAINELENIFNRYLDIPDANVLCLPPSLWGHQAIDYVDPTKRDKFLGKLLVDVIERCKTVMPIYQSVGYDFPPTESLKNLTAEEILLKLPVLMKDSVKGNGFRRKAIQNENLMHPTDHFELYRFYSGGTLGKSTPTFISSWDIEVEAYALARCFYNSGFRENNNIFTTYNLNHKGGRIILRACELLGMKVFLRDPIKDDIRESIRKIVENNIEILATVQPYDINEGDTTKKGGGATFLDFYNNAPDIFGSLIKKAFVTGYWLLPDVISACEKTGVELFTTNGASEVLPISASSTIALYNNDHKCKYNNHHLMLGPHYTLLVDPVSLRNSKVEPVDKVGEIGLLLHTTIPRQGSIYLNYLIGDQAVYLGNSCPCGKTTPIIADIERIDKPRDEVLKTGCVANI